MTERELPRSTRETIYRVGRWEMGRRPGTRPSHIYQVDRVKIGTSYDGTPMFTERSSHQALCGVYVIQTRDTERTDPQSASCAKCCRKHMQLVGRGQHGGRRS